MHRSVRSRALRGPKPCPACAQTRPRKGEGRGWDGGLHPGNLQRRPPPWALQRGFCPCAALWHPGASQRLPPPCAMHNLSFPMAPFKHPGCTHNFEPPRAAAAAAVCTLSGGAPGPGSPWPPHAAPGGAQLHGGMAGRRRGPRATPGRTFGRRTAPPTPEATVGSGRSAGRTCGRTTAAVGGPPEATAWVACVSAAAESGSGSGARCRCSSAAGIGAGCRKPRGGGSRPSRCIAGVRRGTVAARGAAGFCLKQVHAERRKHWGGTHWELH